MARVSEFEQSGADTLEIAISQDEFDRLGSATDPFELRVTILDNAGAELGSFLLSTDPVDWTLDPDTGEYLLIEAAALLPFGNHRTNWDGLVLSSTNPVGLDTVEDGLMVGPFGLPVDADGPLATSVTAATNIPVGTPLTLIDQSVVIPGVGDATLQFNAPAINTPIVTRGADLGNTGSAPPVCFADGTLIATETGETLVEKLQVGDKVRTAHHGLQTIRWIGRMEMSAADLLEDPKKRPVRIGAGALGSGLPKRDLRVSRQHRIALSWDDAKEHTGAPDVLIAAHRLTDLRGVSLVCPKRDLTYYHLLFDQHEVVFANGMPAESLLLGDQAQDFIGVDAVKEIREILKSSGHDQALTAPKPALPVPDGKSQKQIVADYAQQQVAALVPAE